MKKKKKRMTLEQKSAWTGRLFILPWVIGFLLFFAKPMIQSIIFCFSKVDVTVGALKLKFVGLKNFSYIFFEDEKFIPSLLTTIKELLYNVPLIIIFSLFLAVILNQKFKGRTVVRAIFFLPVIISSGIVMKILREDVFVRDLASGNTGFMVTSGLGSNIVFMIFRNLGLPMSVANKISIVAFNMFDLLWLTGVEILIFLAGLQTIPRSLYEAADIEGATRWENFWKITFPMVSPMIVLNLVYAIIDTFTDYNNVLMNKIIVETQTMRYGTGSAMAWVYFLIIFIIIGLVVKLISKKVFYVAD